jgi:hypothetical protein
MDLGLVNKSFAPQHPEGASIVSLGRSFYLPKTEHEPQPTANPS